MPWYNLSSSTSFKFDFQLVWKSLLHSSIRNSALEIFPLSMGIDSLQIPFLFEAWITAFQFLLPFLSFPFNSTWGLHPPACQNQCPCSTKQPGQRVERWVWIQDLIHNAYPQYWNLDFKPTSDWGENINIDIPHLR